MRKRSAVAGFLIATLAFAAASSAVAGDSRSAGVSGSDDAASVSPSPTVVADTSALAATSLLADLESFLRQRTVDVDRLTVEQMVRVMTDWYRSVPIEAAGDGATDMLLFRYGGWSEGCATGFNVSLLRLAGEHGTAGITLMFEPSGGSELARFATSVSDRQSIEAFVEAVHGSPVYRQFGTARPMGVALERGGLR